MMVTDWPSGMAEMSNSMLASARVEAGKVKYTFTFPLKITDFSVKQRSFLGMKVREDIQVTVETAAKVETL